MKFLQQPFHRLVLLWLLLNSLENALNTLLNPQSRPQASLVIGRARRALRYSIDSTRFSCSHVLLWERCLTPQPHVLIQVQHSSLLSRCGFAFTLSFMIEPPALPVFPPNRLNRQAPGDEAARNTSLMVRLFDLL